MGAILKNLTSRVLSRRKLMIKALMSLLLISGYARGDIMTIEKCGSRPNCVSSLDERKKFYIEPLKVSTQKEFEELKQKILSMDRVKMIQEDTASAHFVFTTKLMRFKDDVYLAFDELKKQVEISSRSRVGYSDRGVNRKRVEEIRKL